MEDETHSVTSKETSKAKQGKTDYQFDDLLRMTGGFGRYQAWWPFPLALSFKFQFSMLSLLHLPVCLCPVIQAALWGNAAQVALNMNLKEPLLALCPR